MPRLGTAVSPRLSPPPFTIDMRGPKVIPDLRRDRVGHESDPTRCRSRTCAPVLAMGPHSEAASSAYETPSATSACPFALSSSVCGAASRNPRP
jgi:hypothetical protein